VDWLTEITKVKPGEYFIDDQRIGPYSLWHHQHHFKEVEGGVEMRDAVTYAIPFGWLGQLANWLFVGKQLKSIFHYRRSVLERQFGKDVRRIIAA
jgi:ligand-binding SRPBCC domain-containing protein